SGEIAGRSIPTLTLALVRGLLGAILSERVTDVNALPIAKSRGLKITETSTTEAEDYASLVAAELVTDRGIASVAGTVFFKREARHRLRQARQALGSLSEYRGAPTAEHGCSERWGVGGPCRGPIPASLESSCPTNRPPDRAPIRGRMAGCEEADRKSVV